MAKSMDELHALMDRCEADWQEIAGGIVEGASVALPPLLLCDRVHPDAVVTEPESVFREARVVDLVDRCSGSKKQQLPIVTAAKYRSAIVLLTGDGGLDVVEAARRLGYDWMNVRILGTADSLDDLQGLGDLFYTATGPGRRRAKRLRPDLP